MWIHINAYLLPQVRFVYINNNGTAVSMISAHDIPEASTWTEAIYL